MNKSELKDIAARIDELDERLRRLESRTMPTTDLSMARLRMLQSGGSRRRWRSHILCNAQAFEIAVKMLGEGCTYQDIAAKLKGIPGFFTSSSAVYRFNDFYMRILQGGRESK